MSCQAPTYHYQAFISETETLTQHLLMTREKLVFKVLMGKLVVSMALTLLCMGLSWRQRGPYLLWESLGEVSCGHSWNYPPHYFADLIRGLRPSVNTGFNAFTDIFAFAEIACMYTEEWTNRQTDGISIWTSPLNDSACMKSATIEWGHYLRWGQ